MNCHLVFFIYLKLEMLAQFSSSNHKKICICEKQPPHKLDYLINPRLIPDRARDISGKIQDGARDNSCFYGVMKSTF